MLKQKSNEECEKKNLLWKFIKNIDEKKNPLGGTQSNA
jgi:hypothetical protein